MLFKRRKIEKAVAIMYPNLKRDYGVSEGYSIGQVRNTAMRCKVNKKVLPYVYAIFLDKDNFLELIEAGNIDVDAVATRKEVAEMFFDSDESYTPKQLLKQIVRNRPGDFGDEILID